MYDISAALALCPAVRFIVVLELVVGAAAVAGSRRPPRESTQAPTRFWTLVGAHIQVLESKVASSHDCDRA